MKPNFFIIGAPNSGTTSLWRALRNHPQVYMPQKKEPRFFSRVDYERQWDSYLSLFSDVKREKAIGEASVNYSETHIWPEVPSRIAEHIPKARIIYIVRHPFTRLESCWRQALSSGHWYRRFYVDQRMPLSFERAVREYPHFLGTTRYWRRLQDFRRTFPDDQILLLFFKDFVTSPQTELETCFRFLQVDAGFQIEQAETRMNAGAEKRMQRPIIVNLKRSEAFGWACSLVPGVVRRFARKLLTKPVPSHIEWSSQTRQWVVHQLRDDVDRILAYGNKPVDFWRLE